MAFQPATRKRVKSRLAIAGMSKSGKSLTSLGIARGIVGPEGRIAAVDTENGALSLYAGRFPGAKQPTGFDVMELTNCSPDSYIKAIDDAAKSKYDLLLIDSTTQEWGAILEIVDGNSDKFFGGWKAATPKHNAFIRAIVSAPLHIIVTARMKDEYVAGKDANGRATIQKVGTEIIQRKQFEYEFNAVMTVDLDHTIRVTHSAIDFMPNGSIIPPFDDMGKAIALGSDIARWLNDGDEDWIPPVFKKSFYVNDKEYLSAGIERETFVALMNAGAALDKVTKRGNAKGIVKALTKKDALADLTEVEGKQCIVVVNETLEAVPVVE